MISDFIYSLFCVLLLSGVSYQCHEPSYQRAHVSRVTALVVGANVHELFVLGYRK